MNRIFKYQKESGTYHVVRYSGEEIDSAYWIFEDANKGHPTLPGYVFLPEHRLPSSWFFYRNNKPHRWNGPQCHSPTIFDGMTEEDWFINNTFIDPEQYFAFLDQNEMDINNLTDGDKLLIQMWVEGL